MIHPLVGLRSEDQAEIPRFASHKHSLCEAFTLRRVKVSAPNGKEKYPAAALRIYQGELAGYCYCIEVPMEAQTSEDSEVATATNGAPAPVAAVWHTLLLFAILGAWTWHGMGSANRMRALTDVNRLSFYAQTIAAEWLLLGFVLFGVWKYGAPLTTILGKKWQSAAEVAKDVGIALLFWICSLVLLGTVGVLLQTKQDRSAINFLLPSTTTERLLWLAVALTAGICEEAVFRGYLQRQLQAWTRNVPAGIFLSSIVFGTVHAYQGWRLMIIIWLLGAMLGILAFWRGTVRVGMISHAWQDGLAGLLGGFLKR